MNDAVEAVLFDMDGVLCASEHLSRRAAAQVFKELHGLRVAEEEFIQYGGMGEERFLGGVAEQYGVQGYDSAAAIAKFFDLYINVHARAASADIGYAGARQLVGACRAAGLRTAVASSAGRVKVDANLGAAGFSASDFDAVVAADGFERIKPAPDIFLAAAAAVGVPPPRCVVVEDAPAGVAAARAAGMRVVGLTTSLSQQQMQQLAPDAVRPNISQLSVEDLLAVRYTNGARPPADGSGPSSSSSSSSSSGGSGGSSSGGGSSSSSSSSSSSGGSGGSSSGGGSSSTSSTSSGGGGSGRGVGVPASLQQAATSAPAPNSSLGAGWLDQDVQLPRGYRTRRRDVLKLLPLAGALGCVYVAASRSKAMSYASPRALLNALLGGQQQPAQGPVDDTDARVAAFERYIGDIERRGGGQEVPDFPAGADWFNAPPLSLRRELSGKLLVLDFWTYCCINCMHVLPDLAAIEAKYSGAPVAVVGVHSAKFDNERDSTAIRDAVLRYDVTHPVINDAQMALWGALGVSSWPTLLLVSPRGRLLAALTGEGHRRDLDDFLAAALRYYGARGLLDATPLPQALERDKPAGVSPLRYPGKVAVDPVGRRLFISDSGNHRLLVTDLEGRFLGQVGGNGAALRDGTLEEAAFNRPQGLAYSSDEDALYVADTENHSLRRVDLRGGRVATLAGDGAKGADYGGAGAGATQRLNSPWDVALGRGSVYVAMAGQHQIWRYDPAAGTISNFSGNGYERNQNGPSGSTTSWAQPSGLALAPDGRHMYVADSESSAIRLMDLETGGAQALVGGDPLFSDNLFRFGDVDGVGSSALLQHPLAVAVLPGGQVVVADSYNHKLKVLDAVSGALVSVAGSGRPGGADGRGRGAGLSEPGGLAVGPGGEVYVADTNNGEVRVFRPDGGGAGGELRTLRLSGVPPPRVSPLAAGGSGSGGAADDGGLPPGTRVVAGEALSVEGSGGAIVVSVVLPAGYHLTPGTNSCYTASVLGCNDDGGTGGGAPKVVVQPSAGRLVAGRGVADLEFTVNVSAHGAGSSGGDCAATVQVLASIYFCRDGGVCLFERVAFRVPLLPPPQLGGGAAQLKQVRVRHVVSAGAAVADPTLVLPSL